MHRHEVEQLGEGKTVHVFRVSGKLAELGRREPNEVLQACVRRKKQSQLWQHHSFTIIVRRVGGEQSIGTTPTAHEPPAVNVTNVEPTTKNSRKTIGTGLRSPTWTTCLSNPQLTNTSSLRAWWPTRKQQRSPRLSNGRCAWVAVMGYRLTAYGWARRSCDRRQ
jgi:hypothetical protein